MSKDTDAYTRAKAEVERLKEEEEKNGEQHSGRGQDQYNRGGYRDDRYNRGDRKKQVKVVSCYFIKNNKLYLCLTVKFTQ